MLGNVEHCWLWLLDDVLCFSQREPGIVCYCRGDLLGRLQRCGNIRCDHFRYFLSLRLAVFQGLGRRWLNDVRHPRRHSRSDDYRSRDFRFGGRPHDWCGLLDISRRFQHLQ